MIVIMGRDKFMGFGSMLKDYLNYHKISQTDFAMRLGISKKHMNEILNDNADFSLELMHAISLLTDIDVNLISYVENKKKMQKFLADNFATKKDVNSFFDSFYLKEMVNNKWLKLKDETSNEQKALDLLEFLNVKDFQALSNYMERKVLYKKRDSANQKKIYLWLKHCDEFINKQEVSVYSNKNLDILLEKLKKLRMKDFNESELVKLFNEHGIYLIIQDALKGTKVRGAMDVRGNNPVIYMTKFNKEKASFYFALYHEIGHIKSDYNIAKNRIIVEDNDEKDEDKCDKYALEQMIPSDIWKKINSNYLDKDKIAISNDIPLCFLYSRLAYENKISYSSKEYLSHREKIN